MKDNLWEEGNSIEHLKKPENSRISDQNDTIKETNGDFGKKGWMDIGKQKWIRKCPGDMCERSTTYLIKHNYEMGKKKNSLCRSCNASYVSRKYLFGNKLTEDHRKKCSQSLSGKDNPMFGKNHTLESREKMSKTRLGVSHNCTETKIYRKRPILDVDKPRRKCPECNVYLVYKTKLTYKIALKKNTSCQKCSNEGNQKKHTDETKMKMRCSRIKYIESCIGTQIHPTYNKKACRYMDNLNYNEGWNLLHAENGGEHRISDLGYWVDGYDVDKNIVVEYDEKHHYDRDGNLKQKDILRMNRIKENLKCRFLRYDERRARLYEYYEKLDKS